MALATAPMHSRQVQALQQCDTVRAFWVVPTGLTALEDMNPDEQAKPKADRRTTPGEPYAGKPPVRFDEGRCSPNDTNNCGWFNSFTPSPTLLIPLRCVNPTLKRWAIVGCPSGTKTWRRCEPQNPSDIGRGVRAPFCQAVVRLAGSFEFAQLSRSLN